jgi:ATP adenylyltransferase
VSLERLWAGWRSEYMSSLTDAPPPVGCVLCRVVEDGSQVVWQDGRTAVTLNAFPYSSGHLLVMPVAHVAEPGDLAAEDGAALWATVTQAVAAVRRAYRPDGLNVGANLGRSAGAGIPGHFHMHVVPRWDGDSNFMTSVAEARVLPEPLSTTLEKVRAAWSAP